MQKLPRTEAITLLMMEKLVFKNFTDITRTDSFLELNEKELQQVIEAAIGSPYCSTNEILKSLHRWVNVRTPAERSTQFNEGRIKTFLTLVNKMPTNEFDDKVLTEIFFDDHRLRDNAMCHSFRDKYLRGRLFMVGKHKNRKRKAENIGVMPLTKARILEKSTPTGTQQSTAPSVSLKRAPVPSPNSNEQRIEPPDGSGSKKVISGGDGSDCIGYFTYEENGSWFIGSFNLATGEVEKITDFPGYREYGALLHAYNYLYFMGGRVLQTATSDGQEEKGQVSRRIDVFDMAEQKWMTENLPLLEEAREDFQSRVVKKDEDGRSGFIYVFGGGRTDGSDVEVISETIPLYGIAEQKVRQEQTKATLDQSQQPLDASSLQGEIRNIASDKMTPTLKIPGARTAYSTATFGSKIYTFGAASEPYRLASAYVYDRDTNVFTKLPNMHRKRSGSVVVQHNNFMYIVGGDSDDRKKCGQTIEKFNPTTNEFELIENWLDNVPSDVIFCQMVPHIE